MRPLEQQLRNIEGIKEMLGSATEGRGSVTLEFEPEIDVEQALQDVREKVDLAQAELPVDAEEPRVSEVKFSRFDPMLVINLRGEVPERTLNRISRTLKDRIQSVSGVLEVTLVGIREELLEIIVDPVAMESYDLSPADVLNFVQRNNRLVAAGAMQVARSGRFAIKVPGVIETPEDVLGLPMKVDGERVVHFRDIATVRRTFKDADSYARLNGEPAVALEVVQRNGVNMLDTVAAVKGVLEEARQSLPPGVSLILSRDKSVYVEENVSQLVNDVATAVILVVIVLIGILGLQNALLAGVTIPASFCAAFLLLNAFGFTLNMVVFFRPDHGSRHGGGRRHRRRRTGRPAHGRGTGPDPGLCRSRQAHGLADLFLHRRDHRRFPAAGVLARADRQLPQVSADRADLHPAGLAGHCHVLRAGAGRAVRQGRTHG